MGEKRDAGDYDIISDPAKRLAREGGMLLWLLERAPGRCVLDMAAATGAHAAFLAKHGAEVTGRDIDEERIRYAREKRGGAHLEFEVHDLRVAKGGPFDLVIVIGNTFSLLDSPADVTAALSAAREMLSPGGLMLIHVVNYAGLERKGPRQKVACAEAGGVRKIIVKNMIPTGDGGPALVSFANFEQEGGRWRTWGAQSVLLNLRKDFLGQSVSDAGLVIDGIYGDYDRSTFDEDESPDLLFVVKRAPDLACQ